MNEKLEAIKAKLREHAPQISIYALAATGVAALALITRNGGGGEPIHLRLLESEIDQLKEFKHHGGGIAYDEPNVLLWYTPGQ